MSYVLRGTAFTSEPKLLKESTTYKLEIRARAELCHLRRMFP